MVPFIDLGNQLQVLQLTLLQLLCMLLGFTVLAAAVLST